jgi:Rieske 2Fe-2S family protein
VRPAAPSAPIDAGRLAGVIAPRSEAHPLPPEVYVDPAVLEWELERLFESSWSCVGREEDAGDPGELFTGAVGHESVLVVRGEDGTLRGFFNVCQHRGTRLVTESSRGGQDRLICPYHSWTYDLKGRLRSAEHMRGAGGFDRGSSGLTPVATEALGGWVFVDVSGAAGSLESFLGNLPDHLARHGCGDLRRAASLEYDVGANWKLLSENYQECYHCPTIHPELIRVTPYRSGRYDPARGPWMGGPMELMPGCNTMSLSGTTGRRALPGLRLEDASLVYYYSVLPNLWISLHPDYVLTHRVEPLAPDRTRLVCEWLFHPDAMAADGFDPGDAVEFWDLVNRQDFAACERVQLGVGSRGFRGGRFSDEETGVHFLSAMLARSYLDGRVARAEELSILTDR